MTRFLSQALQAEEPQFHKHLMKLEAASGHPSTDIRLTTEIDQLTKVKLMALGLDPYDTTSTELYHALQERLAADDIRLTRYLRTEAAHHVSAEADVMAGMIECVKGLGIPKNCFVIKLSVIRELIKAQPPKRAMKRLGYRSLASFLKHEPMPLALAAAWLCESETWRSRYLAGYKTLSPHDFETRIIHLIEPTSPRWRLLAAEVIDQTRHTVFGIKEIGSIIFLPLSSSKLPSGVISASLGVALHELNDIRACSTYLQLSQVKHDFGQQVMAIADEEPYLKTQLYGETLPWKLIHHYYARFKHSFDEAVFEPYIQLQDMHWQSVERALAHIDPDLSFWRHCDWLGFVGHDQKPVSMNFVDAALNYCNKLPFEKRIVHFFQMSLWDELLLRYLHPEPVEEAVAFEMQPELVGRE